MREYHGKNTESELDRRARPVLKTVGPPKTWMGFECTRSPPKFDLDTCV